MLSGTAINTIDRIGLSTAAPLIIKDLHLTPALIGIAFSAFFWPYVVMQIPTGSLADRFGAKIVLGWAAGLWSIASACTACVLLTWIPMYLVMEKGFSLVKMGIYASFPRFFGFLAEPIVGSVSDWLIRNGCSVTLSRKSCVVVVQLISGVATMWVGFVAGPIMMVITLTIANCFSGRSRINDSDSLYGSRAKIIGGIDGRNNEYWWSCGRHPIATYNRIYFYCDR
jgi:MFS family permease